MPQTETEIETKKPEARRWRAFVCPDCRFVFRVPRDHDGLGAICPSCRRMLRIPQVGESTAPLVAPVRKIRFAKEDTAAHQHKRTKSSSRKIPPILKIIALALAVLAVIVAIVYFLNGNLQDTDNPVPTDTREARMILTD